jgi:hypothetical protein
MWTLRSPLLRNNLDGVPPRLSPTAPFETRFWHKVDASGDCWLWTGARQVLPKGGPYGRIIREGKPVYAHRAVWWLMYGYWPTVIDHLCRNTLCVNPLHLEDTTQRVNFHRSEHRSAKAVRIGTCEQGHNNWGVRPDNGRRYCVTCYRIAYRERKRARHGAKRAT